MAERKVRIGFCGVGSMGQMAHLRNYVAEDGCEVVALAELRKNTGAEVARRYRIPNVYTDASEMLEKETLDAVVASQPFTRHGILVPELLKAGIPIFTEKPLANSIEVGQRIVDAVAASGTFVMVGYHKRSDPATVYARQEIEALKASGELGALRFVRLLMPPGDWIAAGFTGLVREEEAALPALDWDPPASDMDQTTFKAYTSFVNYYIHQVNLMRHLLGEPYQVAYAEPSGALFVGRSASGVACTIEMNTYRTTTDWQEHALVCFERGWIRIDYPAPLACNRPGQVEIYRDPGDGVTPLRVSPTLPWVHAMRQQARHFLAAVRGEMAPLTTAAEALEDLKIAREYIRLQRGA
jgi:predicted dehydrogenase